MLPSSFAFESLGACSGAAPVRFGADACSVFDARPGNVIVLPAGTGHENLSARPHSLETRVSLLVMNSSSAGSPCCVALMPRAIAALISPGCVTRSP